MLLNWFSSSWKVCLQHFQVVLLAKVTLDCGFVKLVLKLMNGKIFFLLNDLEGKDILEVITSKKEKYPKVAMMVLA